MDTKDPYLKSLENTTTIFGHINRADGLAKQILSGNICGTKSRGRQHTKYTDSLNDLVTRKESTNDELIRRTDDREDWKAMIADVCNRSGMMMIGWTFCVASCKSNDRVLLDLFHIN